MSGGFDNLISQLRVSDAMKERILEVLNFSIVNDENELRAIIQGMTRADATLLFKEELKLIGLDASALAGLLVPATTGGTAIPDAAHALGFLPPAPGDHSASPHTSSVAAKLEDLKMNGEIVYVDSGLMTQFMPYIDATDSTKSPPIEVLSNFSETSNQVNHFNGMLMGEAPSEGAAIVPVRPVAEGYVVDHHLKAIGKENQKPDWVISNANPVVFEHQVGAIIELKAGEGDFDSEAIYQAGQRNSFGRVIITVEGGLENWKVLGIVRAPLSVLGHRLKDPYLTPIAHGGTASVYLSQRPHTTPVIVKFVASAELAARERSTYQLIQNLRIPHTCTLCPAWAEWGEYAVVLNEVCKPATELTSVDVSNLAECIRVLHVNNILHADIRKSNVMRDSRGNIMMIDFGFSKEFPFEEGVYSGTMSTASDGALEAMIQDAPYIPSFKDDWESFVKMVLSFKVEIISLSIRSIGACASQKDRAMGYQRVWREAAKYHASIFCFVGDNCDGVVTADVVAKLCELLCAP